MYRLFWGETPKNAKLLATCQTAEQARRRMCAFMDERNIKSSYMRMWHDEAGYEVVDYGSWSTFFYIEHTADGGDA